MNDDLQLTHLSVGDIPLLVALLRKLDLPGLYDREIKDHGLHTGLSGGWLLTLWLVFILTEGDHTKHKVAGLLGVRWEAARKFTTKPRR